MARKTKEEALETREKLLESALDIMSGRSFSSVSMNEIAERVGLSKGAIYWHFKSKNDILVNLIENLCERAMADPSPDGGAEAGPVDIREYFKYKLSKASGSDRFKKVNMLIQRRYEWPDEIQERVKAMLMEGMSREKAMIRASLDRCRDEGRIRSDLSTDELASLVSAIFHGLFALQINDLNDLDFTKYIDFLFDAFARELRPGSADKREKES